MKTNHLEDTDTCYFGVHLESSRILRQVARTKGISVPKLAAKTKMPTEELNTVLRNLSKEGVVKIGLDKLGFNRVEIVSKDFLTSR